jgi:hypothetical protein
MTILQINDIDLFFRCQEHIDKLEKTGFKFNTDKEEMIKLLYTMEMERREKNEKSDKNIEYNDEIVSIEQVGEKETIDISVTGDNLFYCNGILTKNSFGLPATADLFITLINSEKLEANGQIMVKQLKNRYNDLTVMRRFCLGIDRSKMRLFDLENPVAALGMAPASIGDSIEKSKSDYTNFSF